MISQTPITWSPRASSLLESVEPMNPAEPVTRIFMFQNSAESEVSIEDFNLNPSLSNYLALQHY